MSDMHDTLCDWRLAEEIFLESLWWGLFQIIPCTGGSPVPECRVLDAAQAELEKNIK